MTRLLLLIITGALSMALLTSSAIGQEARPWENASDQAVPAVAETYNTQATTVPTTASEIHNNLDPETWRTPYDTRAGGLCCFFLPGIALGVMVIVMGQVVPGTLFTAGFALLMLDPIAEILIFRVLIEFVPDINTGLKLDWTYAAVALLANGAAVLCLCSGIYILVRPTKQSGATGEGHAAI